MVKKAFQLLKRTFTKPEGLELDAIGPVSRFFGEDRGTPIDRYYIEKFLGQQQHLIKGTVLEIADSHYSKKFGANASKYEVLFINDNNPHATIIGDLTEHQTLPTNTVDCFICTQTFNFIYGFSEAIRGAYQLLKPGGYLLATVAGPSQISRFDMDRWGDYWRFTTLSAQRTFDEIFGKGNVEVDFYGNCLSAISLIRGIAAEEIPKEKLDFKDQDYEVIVTVTARKP